MAVVWRHGEVTADEVREAMASHDLKNATVRTLLRRMEEKGYVTHRAEGRTFMYSAAVQPQLAAAGAVRRVLDRFCGGSVEQLLVGLLESRAVDPNQLQALSRKVSKARQERTRARAGDDD